MKRASHGLASFQGAVALSILTAPGVALACGACTDAILRRSTWLVGVAPPAFLVLAVESVGFMAYCANSGARIRYQRRKGLLVGAGLALAIGVFTALSIDAMLIVMSAAFIYSFLRSVVAERRLGTALTAARFMLVLGFLAWAAFAARPSNQSTERLVRNATTNPDSWDERPSNWIEMELAARPDASQAIEGNLRELRVGTGPQPLPYLADLSLLRLHRLVGGAASVRSEWCRPWDLSRYETDYRYRDPKGLRPPLEVARALCSEK